MLKNLNFIQDWYQTVPVKPSVLTNSLEPSLYVSPKHQTLTSKLDCVCRVTWVILLFFWDLTTSHWLECSSIHVSLLNMILLQLSASHRFEQLKSCSQMLLVTAGFLVAMHLFSWCPQKMRLVVSTDTKLDKSHSSLDLQSSLTKLLAVGHLVS